MDDAHWLMLLDVEFDVLEPPALKERLRRASERVGGRSLAGKPTKAGAGVSHFERRKDQDHPGHTSCFFVVRVDGTSIDFSTRRALDVAGEKTS